MNVYYMNGAGNDFAILDARGKEDLDFSALAKKYCAHTGADGHTDAYAYGHTNAHTDADTNADTNAETR